MVIAIIVCSIVAALECWCCLRAAGRSDYFDEPEFEGKERKEQN